MNFKQLTKLRHLLVYALITCLITLTACENENESDGETTSGPITQVTNAAELDLLFQQIAEIQCNAACDPILEAAGEFCQELVIFEQRDDRAEYLRGIETNRIEFNPEFYRCAYNILTQGNCEEGSIRTICGEGNTKIFTGKVATGEACTSHKECQNTPTQQGYCNNLDGDDLSCNMGVCILEEEDSDTTMEIVVMEGDPCGPQGQAYHQCANDLVCDDDAPMPTCVREQTVGLGEVCNFSVKRCSANLYCLPQDDNSEVTICKGLNGLNESCSRFQPCDFDFYCDIQARDMPGTCVNRIADNAACTQPPSRDFDENQCTFGSACLNQVCKPIRFEGESCEISEQCNGRAEQYACQANVCTTVCN